MASAARLFDTRIGIAVGLRQFRLVFRIEGRSTRSELLSYWLTAVFAALATFWLVQVIGEQVGLDSLVGDAVFLVVWLGLIAPWPALLVRRMHDQNRSGRWAVALLAGLILLSAFGSDVPMAAKSGTEIIAGMILSLAHFIISFAPGTYGSNRYGFDPRLGPEPT